MAEKPDADATDAAVTTENDGDGGGDFDRERAMSTIKDQRKAEKALKAELKEAQAKLAGYTKAEEDAAEANKAAEVKLAERDATIVELQGALALLHVEHDFVAKAASKGIADPALAFLAAKEQGLLGNYDPKAGVGEHNWEELGEKYPSFATREATTQDSGDAGTRSKGKATTPGSQFNQAVRRSIRG